MWNSFVAFVAKYKWWILGIILAIIIVLYLRRNWYKVRHIFQPRDIDIETGESINISEQRKAQLETLARDLYDDIYDTPINYLGIVSHTKELYTKADALSDNELLYLARYYKRYLANGNSLWMDIDDEYSSPFDNYMTSLQAHLSKIGER